MALVESDDALARFDFTSGHLRGSTLLLHASCLVHRGAALLETLPLATVAAVRVSFERNFGKLRWGAALLVSALVLLLLASPLAGLASDAAAQMAPHLRDPASGEQGVAGVLHATFSFFEALANMLPGVAAALAVAGVGLAALGWLGETRLTVGLAGLERTYWVRGRDAQLRQFAEALSERAVECAAAGSR